MPDYSRRDLLEQATSLGVTVLVPWDWDVLGESGLPGAACRGAGTLLYCIRCNQEFHRDCANETPCRGAPDADWVEMFRDAAAEHIETVGAHELIAVRIELDDTEGGVL